MSDSSAVVADLSAPLEEELPTEEFGEAFVRGVLHQQRVLDSINRILGPSFDLGPMGAGPGRRIAVLTAHGEYQPVRGEPLPEPGLGYRVLLPVSVDFDLDLRVDRHRFHAEVLVPLIVRLRLERPLSIVWDIEPPAESEIGIEITGERRRATVLQKLTGIDGELRRFLLRFVTRELDKPHVRRACRIPVIEVIDGAWPQIAAQFLPNGAEDRH